MAVFILKMTFAPKPMIDLSQAISVSIGDLAPVSEKLPAKAQPAAVAEPEPTTAQPVQPETIAQPEPVAEPVKKIKPEPAPVEVKKPIEKATPKAPEKTKPAADEINLKKAQQKQKAALDKIKKMSALEKIKQDINTDAVKSLAKAPAKPVNRVIAAGTAIGGLDKIEAAEYLQQLDSQIKQSWTLPQWLKSQNLRAQVLVKFNVNGQIISNQVLTSSGNRTYDSYCMQAVEKSAPFPKVPVKFSDKFSVDGLVIGFPE